MLRFLAIVKGSNIFALRTDVFVSGFYPIHNQQKLAEKPRSISPHPLKKFFNVMAVHMGRPGYLPNTLHSSSSGRPSNTGTVGLQHHVCHEHNVCVSSTFACCTKDEGRPLGAALQEEAPNRLKLRWSRAMVVSVKEKAKHDFVR